MAAAVMLDRLAVPARVAKHHRMEPMHWITNRLPTADDADVNGEVIISKPSDGRPLAMHWTDVCEGHMWRITTTKRRIISTNRTVHPNGVAIIDAVADDGTAWWIAQGDDDNGWRQLPPLPDREIQP